MAHTYTHTIEMGDFTTSARLEPPCSVNGKTRLKLVRPDDRDRFIKAEVMGRWRWPSANHDRVTTTMAGVAFDLCRAQTLVLLLLLLLLLALLHPLRFTGSHRVPNKHTTSSYLKRTPRPVTTDSQSTLAVGHKKSPSAPRPSRWR